jgi:hypothetical protein
VRVHLSPNTVQTLLDASPSVATQVPMAAFASTTTPSGQFSNNPATGVQSTLSGAPVTNFQTFKGSGIERQLHVSAGIVWRF